MFVLFYSVITAVSVLYVGLRMIRPLKLPRLAATLCWVALIFIGFLGMTLSPRRAGGAAFEETMFPVVIGVMQSCLFLLTFLLFARDVLALPWLLMHRFSGSVKDHIRRRRRILFNISSVVLVFATLFFGATGYDDAHRVPDVREVDIPLPGLPKAFDGYRIAVLSDLHVGGRAGNQWLTDIVTRANAIGPDAVVILGDVVDGKPEDLYADAALLTGLRAPDGIFLILGNHEYISGYDEWVAAFSKMGLPPLLNARRMVARKGARLAFIGITDPAGTRFNAGPPPDPARAMRGVPDTAVRILLSHRPGNARENAALGYALQLSGHTHGGQMPPGQLFALLANRYLAGLYDVDGMSLYVTRGTGFFGRAPIRVFAPSEISLWTLRPAGPDKARPARP